MSTPDRQDAPRVVRHLDYPPSTPLGRALSHPQTGYARPEGFAGFARPVPVPRERLVVPAWIALAVGVVALCGSPVLILNNFTGLLGVVGILIAFVALFGNRRLVATLALLLCLGGVAATVAFQKHWSDQLDRVTHGATSASWCRAASCAPPSVDGCIYGRC